MQQKVHADHRKAQVAETTLDVTDRREKKTYDSMTSGHACLVPRTWALANHTSYAAVLPTNVYMRQTESGLLCWPDQPVCGQTQLIPELCLQKTELRFSSYDWGVCDAAGLLHCGNKDAANTHPC